MTGTDTAPRSIPDETSKVGARYAEHRMIGDDEITAVPPRANAYAALAASASITRQASAARRFSGALL